MELRKTKETMTGEKIIKNLLKERKGDTKKAQSHTKITPYSTEATKRPRTPDSILDVKSAQKRPEILLKT